MNRLSPKALTVSNLTEAFLEETRAKNMRNVIEFNQKREPEDQPARGILIGLAISGACWAAAFGLYWIIRLCS